MFSDAPVNALPALFAVSPNGTDYSSEGDHCKSVPGNPGLNEKASMVFREEGAGTNDYSGDLMCTVIVFDDTVYLAPSRNSRVATLYHFSSYEHVTDTLYVPGFSSSFAVS